MREWRKILNANGHYVTSRWLEATEVNTDQFTEGESAAWLDINDIQAADILISKTFDRGIGPSGGGRHIEYGIAFMMGKILINVGGVESIFHMLSTTHRCDTINEACEYLKRFRC